MIELSCACSVEPRRELVTGEPQNWAGTVFAVPDFDHAVVATLLDAAALLVAACCFDPRRAHVGHSLMLIDFSIKIRHTNS